MPALSGEPLFTVIIPTYNRWPMLSQCLDSLQSLEGEPEIIVVDDGSDPPVETCGPRVTLIRQSRKGPAAARNFGASRARSKYLAFTDDDCVVEPHWLEAFELILRERPDTLIGGRVRNGEPDNWAAAFNHDLLEGIIQVTEGTPRWFVSSNNFCISASAFARMKGFNDTFKGAAGEDREFCERWRRGGGELTYAPAAVVEHRHPQEFGGFWAMHKRYGAASRALSRLRPERSGCMNLLRLYRIVSKRQPVSLLLLSQLAVLAGYVNGTRQ